MGPHQGARVRRYGFALPACPESVVRARHLTTDRLAYWGLFAQIGDTAALVVSELVTNAVLHTASERFRCDLVDSDGRLRISVQDEGSGPQAPRLDRDAQPGDEPTASEHGRGLLLVDAVCDTWGSQEHDGSGPGTGHTVWAELTHGCGTWGDTFPSGSGAR
jgi:anti-sigma regulatory factor (Ser/Thr protein kinase)